MSCCPGPERGKPFDPDAELPCEADMARFGDEDDEASDLFDDEHDTGYAAGRGTGSGRHGHAMGSPRAAGNALVAKVAIGALLLAVCAGIFWMSR